KPFLRGQDIKRWSPHWASLWIILLKSSENHRWEWSETGERAEDVFANTYPSIYRHLKTYEKPARERQDKGRFWWELRSCTYYDVFEQLRLLYQEIQYHPAYSYGTEPLISNNKCFILPSANLFLLAVLNSPLMWWFNWRYLPHMKDEALSPTGERMIEL